MNGYNSDTARRLVLLSDCIYADATNGEAENAAIDRTGADKAIAIDFGSIEVIVAKYGPDAAIAFRGSSELDDFVLDSRFLLVRRDGLPGRVHRGLSRELLDCFPVVRRIASELVDPTDGFLDIGGHSKGGAEALFASFLFKRSSFWRLRSCHVFGAPAVGDRAFAKEFDHAVPSTFTHVFGSDIVARAPIVMRALGRYRQVGRTVYHTRTGKTLFRPSPIRYFLDGLRGVSRRLGRRDHGLDRYFEAITRGGDS